mmetsp:Transcript_9344/g.19291  ORF Transcript_9344/g.19291 Transcript_9344/m.19291 type:complete len:304 (-) Transcript_9344:1643-2554(-)
MLGARPRPSPRVARALLLPLGSGCSRTGNPAAPSSSEGGRLFRCVAVDVAEEVGVAHGARCAVLHQVRHPVGLDGVPLPHHEALLEGVPPRAHRPQELVHLLGEGVVVLDVEAEGVGDAHRPEEILQELRGGRASHPRDEDAPVVQQVAPAAVQHLRRQRHRRRHHQRAVGPRLAAVVGEGVEGVEGGVEEAEGGGERHGHHVVGDGGAVVQRHVLRRAAHRLALHHRQRVQRHQLQPLRQHQLVRHPVRRRVDGLVLLEDGDHARGHRLARVLEPRVEALLHRQPRQQRRAARPVRRLVHVA